MSTVVSEIPAASAFEALAHFKKRLQYETDCWDVHYALTEQSPDFLLIDVRSPDLFQQGHIKGAINIPHGKMTAGYMKRYAAYSLFIVYCAGPHCNGANKAAISLARLELPVKEMIGGICGWLDEGFEIVQGE